jgi:uridine kinase
LLAGDGIRCPVTIKQRLCRTRGIPGSSAGNQSGVEFPRLPVDAPPVHAASVAVIGIAGPSGAGKSWLARNLQRRLGPLAARLSLDDFYRDLAHLDPTERARTNFDHPESIDWPLFESRLAEILEGGAPPLPRYDFKTHTRSATSRRWHPRPVVVVEGLWTWWRPALRRLYRLRVFVDGEEPLLFERRLRRDIRERERSQQSVRHQWDSHVWPMARRYVLPQARHAHVQVAGTPSPADLVRLAARIRRLAVPGWGGPPQKRPDTWIRSRSR